MFDSIKAAFGLVPVALPATPLQEARDRLELFQTEMQLKAMEAQRSHIERSLAEATWGRTPFEDFDGSRWFRWAPIANPNQPQLSVFATVDGKQDGAAGAFVRTMTDLQDTRVYARWLAASNGWAINILEAIQDFVIGDGVKFTASTKDEATKGLVAQVQDVIDDWLECCWFAGGFAAFCLEFVLRHRRDGEVFVRRFIEKDDEGRDVLVLRFVEPEQVVEPPSVKAEEQFGIRTDPDDVCKIEAYFVKYDAQDEGEWVEADEILHLKANVDSTVRRGLSDFFAVGSELEGTKKLLRNVRDGEGVRAAIAGFWEYDGATPGQVAAQVAGTSNTLQPPNNPLTGKAANQQTFAPGTIIHTPKGKKFVDPPGSPASEKNIGTIQACLRSVYARWGMPEFFSGDASNNNFASILVSGSPFVRRTKRYQGTVYKPPLLSLVWDAVLAAAEDGQIEGASAEQVEDAIEIQAEFPTPEINDEQKQGQVDNLDIQNGTLSLQTRRMRRGLDNEQEQKNRKEEPPPQQPLLPFGRENDGTQPGLAKAGATTPADTANALRATVGGSAAIAALQQAYYGGLLPREAAIANAKIVFGFEDAQAQLLFPETAPVKLTPASAPTPTTEGRAYFFHRPARSLS